MKILILYGTTEGQTRKISEFIAKQLRGIGDVVNLIDATGDTTLIDLRQYERHRRLRRALQERNRLDTTQRASTPSA